MMKLNEPIIKYSYTSYVPYKPLEDGTPAWHHDEYIIISGTDPMSIFLNSIADNSKIGSILNLSWEIVENIKI